jgi:hypothetical protein
MSTYLLLFLDIYIFFLSYFFDMGAITPPPNPPAHTRVGWGGGQRGGIAPREVPNCALNLYSLAQLACSVLLP